jgi:hypothetical protein
MDKQIEDEFDVDLEFEIESFNMLSEKQLSYVIQEDWSKGKGLKTVDKMYMGNHKVTELTINQAIACITLAAKLGLESNEKIVSVIERARVFFDYFESRYQHYIKTKTYDVFLLEDKEETEKNANYFSDIVVFESKITKALAKFKTQLKALESTDRSRHLVFPTFNDTPIPFLMRETVEEKHPELKTYLEKRFENAKEVLPTSTPENKSGKSTRVSERPKKKKS